jgi:hypothetical protein
LEFTCEKIPLEWARAQDKLGVALSLLGEREGSAARLGDAVAAHRSALQEFTRDKVPLDWAYAQYHLGVVLWALGEREVEPDKARGCATLKTARDHHAAALEEFRKADASYYVGLVQDDIAGLDDIISRFCGEAGAPQKVDLKP